MLYSITASRYLDFLF